VISVWEAKQTATQRTIINSWENRSVQGREVSGFAMALTWLHNFQGWGQEGGGEQNPFLAKEALGGGR
jgi:hypothetical protein